MLEFVKSVIVSYFKHPMLMALFISAAVFIAVGLVVEQVTGNGVASAFFLVYAIMAIFLGAVGYATLLAAKLAKKFKRRFDVVS